MTDCQKGVIPRLNGGVIAFVQPHELGKRVINLCQISMWTPNHKSHCSIPDIRKDQAGFPEDAEDYPQLCNLNGGCSTIFHELAHFRDIAAAMHRGRMENAFRLGNFMTGFSTVPDPPSTTTTTTTTTTTKTPTTTEPACVDKSRYCASSAYWIRRYPHIYCRERSYYGKNCPASCGKCSTNSFILQHTEHAAYERATFYTNPEWINKDWSDFPSVQSQPTKRLERSSVQMGASTLRQITPSSVSPSVMMPHHCPTLGEPDCIGAGLGPDGEMEDINEPEYICSWDDRLFCTALKITEMLEEQNAEMEPEDAYCRQLDKAACSSPQIHCMWYGTYCGEMDMAHAHPKNQDRTIDFWQVTHIFAFLISGAFGACVAIFCFRKKNSLQSPIMLDAYRRA